MKKHFVSGKKVKVSKLRVVSTASGTLSKKMQLIEATRAKYQKWWEEADNNEKHPLTASLGKARINRTWGLIEDILQTQAPLTCIDVGCGDGTLARRVEGLGVKTTCVDVVHHPCPGALQGCLPYLGSFETPFDLVLCTDVIAELDPHLHRLALSELAALMSRKGTLVCSTPIDTASWEPCERFLALLQTEFEVVATRKSYHHLSQIIKKLLPSFEPGPKALSLLENVSRWVFDERGVTHLICVARRRKLF